METSPVAWALAMLRRKPVRGLATHWRVLFFAFLGATTGTMLDALHVWNDTAGYRDVWTPLLDVAWYVPLEFAVAGVIVGMFRPELDEELHRRRSDLPEWKILAGILCMSVLWLASGSLGRLGLSNTAIAAMLLPVSAVNWLFLDRTPQGAIAAGLTAVAGVLVEAAIVKTGTYHYNRPDFLGVPIWLPTLYFAACVAVGNLGRFCKYSWDPPREKPAERPREPRPGTA